MAGVHVVVGAAGATGRRVVRHLREAGHRVRAVTRDGRSWGAADPELEWAAADAADPASLTQVCGNASVLYHCAMPPLNRWRTDFPVLTDSLIATAAEVGARLVYADDTWMYGRVTEPMTELTPWRPVSAAGVLRAWLAERMLSAAAASRIEVSIVRAGELYGPGVRSMIAGNVFEAARRGRTVHWFGNPDLPLTPTFIEDFARTVAVVGAEDTSTAAVWHVPHPAATTGRELAVEACRQAGNPCRLRSHGTGQLRLAGLVWPLARDGAELVYQFEQPFVVDGTRTADRFEIVPTPYADGIQLTLALGPAKSDGA